MAGSGRGFLIARAQGNPSALAPALARLATDAGLPVQSLTTLDDRVGELVMPQRLGRALLGLFGILALVLTAVGVYGLVACVVAGRTREIGVRIALGAAVTDIVRVVQGGALVPVVAGLAAGISLAWWAGRMAAPFMYGIDVWDLTTVSLTAALILAGASMATLVPTRRAVLIDPVKTLRAE